MNSKLFIVMYHYVRDLKKSKYGKINGLDLKLFKNQIKYLKSNFSIITMEEAVASFNTQTELPPNSVLLTFDDGYIDHYENVFPILKEENIQGSFFIPGITFTEHKLLEVNKIHFILANAKTNHIITDLFCKMNYYRGSEYEFPSNDELYNTYAVSNRFDNKDIIFIKRLLQTVLPEKLRKVISSGLFEKYIGVSEESFARGLYMSKEQMKCMKSEGMFIGLHGYDHHWLGNMSEYEIEQDINKSLNVMDEFIHRDSWVMNYPYGSYNDSLINIIQNRGCTLGLTTEVRVADLIKDTRYKIPRLDTNDFPPKSENYINYKFL